MSEGATTMTTKTEISTYEVEFLVHQNEVMTVTAKNEDEAYEKAREAMTSLIKNTLAYAGADWEHIDTRRVTKTTAYDIDQALVLYKSTVQSLMVTDHWDHIAEVSRAVESEDWTPVYEVQETAAEQDIHIDLDDEDVVNTIRAGLRAMVASWTFQRSHS
jgi:hypothetical protein